MNMHGFKKTQLAIIAALLAVPTVAWAGKLTGVEGTPSPVTTNAPVTITLEGSGKCKRVSIKIDGVAVKSLDDVNFGNGENTSVTHTFTTVGGHVIKAKTRGKKKDGCKKATVTDTVTVEAPLRKPGRGKPGRGERGRIPPGRDRAPLVRGWGGATNPTPIEGNSTTVAPITDALKKAKIRNTKIEVKKLVGDPKVTIPPPLLCINKPGGACILPGEWLGKEAGTATLIMANGQKHGIKVLEWYNDAVGLEFPKLTGISDQKVFIQLQRKDGKATNLLPMLLSATRVFQTVPRSAVKLVSCGTQANKDDCIASTRHYENTLVGHDNYACNAGRDAVFLGTHRTYAGEIGDDKGVDTYEIDLANGWRIEHIDFKTYVSEAGEATIHSPEPATANGGYWKPSIRWQTSPGDWGSYCVNVYMSGPKGTSWK